MKHLPFVFALTLTGCGGMFETAPNLPPRVVICPLEEQKPVDDDGLEIACPTPEDLQNNQALVGHIYIAFEACRALWLANKQAREECVAAHSQSE